MAVIAVIGAASNALLQAVERRVLRHRGAPARV
jgi:hypothetical protein